MGNFTLFWTNTIEKWSMYNNCVSSSNTIIIFRHISVMISSSWTFILTRWRSFGFWLYISLWFYPKETVKCSWSDPQSSSRDYVHVFMYSYSGGRDWKYFKHHTRFSMCVTELRICVIHSHRDMQNRQDLYLNSIFGLIFTDSSPYRLLI